MTCPGGRILTIWLKESSVMDSKRFFCFFLGLITFSILVLVGGAFLIRPQQVPDDAAAPYQGTDLGGVPAPNFQLVDQTGIPITLSHLRKRPVVLTFLYTHCPGPCPLMAEKLRSTAELLGAQANQVSWLAVSLDPQADTPASATAFVQTHRLTGRLHYLLGTLAELEPIWKAYAIGVQPLLATPSAENPSLMHTAGAFVIDQAEHERLFLGNDFAPTLLVTELRTLLTH